MLYDSPSIHQHIPHLGGHLNLLPQCTVYSSHDSDLHEVHQVEMPEAPERIRLDKHHNEREKK